ncbi:GntR family transcriptional regulator [Oricola thermophila]|uniref:GntR family transcriptional regulator n=1 Tax=Oricola thermophila TaxID=2742145 RepID=A0A6N1VGX8_9HYPH|nr:GntR family transcriptional regulator [Oricola thermophila]QKV18542.1 GntR family transcriptional regulator [Oricola thermophila]
MNELALTPIDTSAISATEKVFRSLYDAVVSLRLPPGTKVSETEVAGQLGVSRQPVRDAFFRLSKLGFLSIRPQRATLIRPISERAVLDALFTRTAIEVECLRLAIKRLDDTGLARLRDNLAEQADALRCGLRAEFHALDEALHETICDIAGHRHAWTLILEQKAHMDRVRFMTLSEGRRHRVLAEHKAIITAVEQRDPSEAERRLRDHIGDIRTVLAAARIQYPDYFEVHD